jgi:hypothetical protein
LTPTSSCWSLTACVLAGAVEPKIVHGQAAGVPNDQL